MGAASLHRTQKFLSFTSHSIRPLSLRRATDALKHSKQDWLQPVKKPPKTAHASCPQAIWYKTGQVSFRIGKLTTSLVLRLKRAGSRAGTWTTYQSPRCRFPVNHQLQRADEKLMGSYVRRLKDF